MRLQNYRDLGPGLCVNLALIAELTGLDKNAILTELHKSYDGPGNKTRALPIFNSFNQHAIIIDTDRNKIKESAIR